MKYFTLLPLTLGTMIVFESGIKAEDKIPEYATGSFKLLKSLNVGMVSTLGMCENDKCLKPYGSVMPYCLDEKGRVVVYISDLAVHTDNINANPFASVMVFKPDEKGNVFNGSRVTMSGKFRKVDCYIGGFGEIGTVEVKNFERAAKAAK
tara:strand:- start:3108 stop:3557 length:450 start_codon:yes stop_codon:yes gene_type:complete